MTEKPNCSTCTNQECKYLPLKDRVGKARKWNAGILKHVEFTPRSFTEEMGCLLHPGAREYLMTPEIKELERLSELCDKRIGFESQKVGYEKAISLIKNGVKK